LLFRIGIEDARPIVDLPQPARDPHLMEERLHEGRLACTTVPDDGDVPDLPAAYGYVRSHLTLPGDPPRSA